MKYTIIVPDGTMGVDGRWTSVSMTGLPATLHAVQWDGAMGYEEYTTGQHLTFTSPTKYQAMIDRFNTAIALEDVVVPPTLTELRRIKRKEVDVTTTEVIRNFVYNSNQYDLSTSVIDQLRDHVSMVSVSDDPALYFPLAVVMGETDGIEEVETIPTLAAFKNVITAAMEHVKDKRAEARTIKLSFESMDYATLEAWVDPRI